MSKAKFDIRIGTSGWYYNHWSGLFYPPKLPKTKWFQYYAKHFDSVEVNNTFYQLPKQQSVKKWYGQVPNNLKSNHLKIICFHLIDNDKR